MYQEMLKEQYKQGLIQELRDKSQGKLSEEELTRLFSDIHAWRETGESFDLIEKLSEEKIEIVVHDNPNSFAKAAILVKKRGIDPDLLTIEQYGKWSFGEGYFGIESFPNFDIHKNNSFIKKSIERDFETYPSPGFLQETKWQIHIYFGAQETNTTSDDNLAWCD